jgi:hypothetical protein
MENNYYENESPRVLQVNDVVKDYLLETAKWAKLLAIVGFVSLGLMVIMGLSMGTIIGTLAAMSPEAAEISGLGGGFFAILYIGMALIYFVPIKYLYDFSSKVKKAIQITDQNLFNEAMMKLKSHYKFIGILMLIMIILYVGMFVMMLIAGIAAAAMR